MVQLDQLDPPQTPTPKESIVQLAATQFPVLPPSAQFVHYQRWEINNRVPQERMNISLILQTWYVIDSMEDRITQNNQTKIKHVMH